MTRARLARRPAPIESEPDLTALQKVAVVRAIRWAWHRVVLEWPKIVAEGREEEITAKLCDVLGEQTKGGKRRAPGLSQFETVNRGAKASGANSRIEYQPDLTFRPISAPRVRNRNRWGWFVECKIIDEGHSVHLYCEKGVLRYIDGRYAPRMPSAAMLAYVRNHQKPSESLEPILREKFDSSITKSKMVPHAVASRHDRARGTPPCIAIELIHVWLSASEH